MLFSSVFVINYDELFRNSVQKKVFPISETFRKLNKNDLKIHLSSRVKEKESLHVPILQYDMELFEYLDTVKNFNVCKSYLTLSYIDSSRSIALEIIEKIHGNSSQTLSALFSVNRMYKEHKLWFNNSIEKEIFLICYPENWIKSFQNSKRPITSKLKITGA